MDDLFLTNKILPSPTLVAWFEKRMTAITVVSSFTAISPDGKVNLENCSVKSRKVGEIKDEISHATKIPRERQSLWWHGYLLDQDEQSLLDACVGFNKDERIEPGIAELVICLTAPIEKRLTGAPSPTTRRRFRSGSFDVKGDDDSYCVIL